MKTKIDAYFAGKEEALAQAVSRLVAIPSVKGEAAPGAPFGPGPAAALEEAISLARQLGLSAQNLEGYVGVADLNQQEDALHILAHLDVVEPGPGWSITTPYAPVVVGDLLYGRGTSDDKGPLVAALFAMKAAQDLGVPLTKNVRLVLGTDEESGFHDLQWYYGRYPYAPYAFSPDAAFPLTNLEKGRLQSVMEKAWEEDSAPAQVLSLTGSLQVNVVPPSASALVRGVSLETAQGLCRAMEGELGVTFTAASAGENLSLHCAGLGTHASTPEEGQNALTALITLLCRLPLSDCEATRTLHGLSRLFPHGDHGGEALGIAQSDPLAGPLTITLTMMDWNLRGLSARFDARTPLCTTRENFIAVAKAALSALGISLEGDYVEPHHTPGDSPFVKTLLDCYTLFTGQPGQCLSTGGGTYVHDIPGGVAFGTTMPGFVSGIHGPDERVSLSDLLTSCKIFTQAILDLCQ